MLRIGLTGGIGSGKSTVAEIFARRGTPIIDTDVIARKLVEPGQPALEEIARHFGSSVLDASGQLNRSHLADLVFSNATERSALESILHPRIRVTVMEQLAALDAPYCIVVVPLLLETGSLKTIVDRVLVIDCPEAQQIARVASRDHLSEARIHAVMRAQLTRKERVAQADDVIVNDGDIAALESAVAHLHDRYLALAAKLKR